MFLYCKTWNLSVNPAETEVLFLNKYNYSRNLYLHVNVDADFSFLGLTFDQKVTFLSLFPDSRTALRDSFAAIKKVQKI